MMQTKWGKKNLELIITGDKTSDANFLFTVEKMVCDRNYLDSLNVSCVKAIQTQLHTACEELYRLKEKKSLITRIKKIFSK